MANHYVETSDCPECKAPMSGHFNMEGEAGPEDGDYTICAHCIAPLVYKKDGEKLRTAKLIMEFLDSEEREMITKGMAAVRAVKAENPDAFKL